MSRAAGRVSAYRGAVTAAAVVIDAPLLGTTEARRRVLELWQPGVTVRALPDGCWLVSLFDPVELRAELAPGLPLVDIGGGLAMPGQPGPPPAPGTVVLERHGERSSTSSPACPRSTSPAGSASTGWR